MDKKLVIGTLIVCLIGMLLSGCWDKVEINERAFITAMGVDKYESKNGDVKQTEEEKEEIPKSRFVITYVYPNIEAVGKQAKGEAKYMVSSVGNNPFETTKQLGTRLHQQMFFEHLKVMIIGEDVAKDSDMLKEILDSLERHNQVNRRVFVLIAKGKAKDVLNVNTEFESDVGLYLSSLTEASESTARFNILSLGNVLQSLHDDNHALMPKAVAGEKDIKVAGTAVIRNYALVGWLDETENISLMFLMDEIKEEVITVTNDDNNIIPYLITSSSTKLTADMEDGQIKANYLIEMEGDLRQYKLGTSDSVLDDRFLKKTEKEIEDHIKKQIMKTVIKMQKEFKTDEIGIDDYLSKFKPKIWKEVKDEWSEIFPNIDINVTVDAKIRRIGLTR